MIDRKFSYWNTTHKNRAVKKVIEDDTGSNKDPQKVPAKKNHLTPK